MLRTLWNRLGQNKPTLFLAFLGLTAAWMILMLRQYPCIDGEDSYRNACYTDITTLYHWRGMKEGLIPILEAELEYPVGSAILMEFARRLLPLFGGGSQPGATSAQAETAAHLYFGINAVLLFGFMLVTIWAISRMAHPKAALLVAVSPAVMTTGLINWDALAVALTAVAMLAWSRSRPLLTGLFLGLGIAAKLYPALLLGPLLILCLRAGRMRAFFHTLTATAITWIGVNLPYFLANPTGWLYFWTFNYDERGADLGSIWLVLSQLGQAPTNLSRAEILLMLLGCIVIAILLLVAPTSPRLLPGLDLVFDYQQGLLPTVCVVAAAAAGTG